MIKVETLQAFISVARFNSFTAAADYHQQTPMALSKQVSTLEHYLREALFTRTTRSVQLTEFGQTFLEKAQALISQHQALETWLDEREDEVNGHLSICVQHNEMLTETVFPWLSEFCDLYPNVNLSFDVQEGVIDINKHQYDIYWGVSEYLGNKHPGLKKRALWRSTYGIYGSPKYIAKHGLPTSIEELQHHHVIGYLHNQPNNILLFNDPQDVNKSFQHVVMKSKVQSSVGMTELAQQGLGLINAAADERSIKCAVSEGSLVPILEEYWSDMAEVYIYFHQTKVQQKKVRTFIDFFLPKRDIWSKKD